jgi:hypothetical protein
MEKIRVLTVLALVVLSFTTSTASAAEATPDGCLFVAYTSDGANHYSLVKENATLVGQFLTVMTDCESDFLVSINGQPRYGGKAALSFDIPLDTRSLTIESESFNFTMNNLTVFPAADWGEFVLNENGIIDPITFSAADFETTQALTVLMSSLLLWICTTILAWRGVNWWVDRYHLEEVV